jgi:hypothetical protein
MCTGDGDLAAFKGLPEHIECFLCEFCDFIKEEDPSVSQRDFSWLWVLASTYD